MSRVTIDDIQHDASGLDNMSWADITKLYQIEVVPRKMVEMIIERLKRNTSSCRDDSYANFILTDVLQYAESLLKKFEEE